MAYLSIKNVAIKGIAACVPKKILETSSIYKETWGSYDNFMETTGVQRHRVAPFNICSSDLCQTAAEELINQLNWDKSTIDALIFVTQTPDYIEPATSCILQDKLGLTQDCFTLDISLGCSGWVYAMSVICSLMQNGTIKRGLLLAGETPSKRCSANDKSAYPLFGDAGTVTALEYIEGSPDITFVLNTDGEGFRTIIIPSGAERNPVTVESLVERERAEGVLSNDLQLQMDGMSVFSFAISKAPKSVNALLEKVGELRENVNFYFFHQANLFMNEKIRKKLKLTPEQVPYSIADFGNTSSASIPLTMVTQSRAALLNGKVKNVGCGFGIGLSWGSVFFETEKIIVPPLIEM